MNRRHQNDQKDGLENGEPPRRSKKRKAAEANVRAGGRSTQAKGLKTSDRSNNRRREPEEGKEESDRESQQQDREEGNQAQVDQLIMERRGEQEAQLLERIAENDKERKFLKRWHTNCIKKENDALNLWHECVLLYEYGDEVEELPALRSFDESLNFNSFMEAFWPKCMQIAAFELAKQLKAEPVRFGQGYMKDLPPSTLNNLDDVHLFEQFFWDLMDIEVDRAVKYQVLLKLGRDAVQELKKKIQRSSAQRIDLREEQKALDQFSQSLLGQFIVDQLLNAAAEDGDAK